MDSKFTIIIQGPLNPISINNIPNYEKFGKVVVSTWGDESTPYMDQIESMYPDMVLRVSPLPSTTNVWNEMNVYYQTLSTWQGLSHVTTPYVIKVRSDEYYTDLGPFVEKILAYPDKLITNNILFLRNAVMKYHVSDHVYGSQTTSIKNTTDLMLRMCELNKKPHHLIDLSAEQMLAVNFILQKGVELQPLMSRFQMLHHIDIVPASQLGDVHIAINGWEKTALGDKCGKTWNAATRKELADMSGHWIIESMDEL